MVSWGVIEKNKYLHWLKLIIIYIAIFAITHWYLSYYRNMLYSLSADEGYILYGAKRVLDGQIMYRDFFQFYPPGNFYLLALIYKLFGYSFTVAREAAIIIDSIINVLVFYLSYKALKAWYAIIPPLFFMILGFPNWIQFSHYWTSELFFLLSLIFFLWYLEQDKHYCLYISGFLIGITTLFLQMPGVYGGILFLILLFILKFRQKGLWKLAIKFTISAAIPLITVFGYLAIKHAFIDFIKQQFLMILKIYPKMLAFNPLGFIFKGIYPLNVFIGIYFFVSILSIIYLFIFYKRIKQAPAIIIIGNFVLFLTIIHSMDIEHLLPNIPLFLIMILLPFKGLLDYTKQHAIQWHRVFYYLLGTIAIISIIWGVISLRSNINRINTQAYRVSINGTPLWTFSEKQAYEINEFFPQAEEILYGEKNVFVYPYGALLYVLLNLNNPIGFDYAPIYAVDNDNLINSFDIPIIKLLKKYNVDYVIYSGWNKHYVNSVLFHMHSLPYNMNSILDNYIFENYDVLLKIDNEMLLKIKKQKHF